ncbi:MAG TPA: hypothetical protein VN813_04635 [Luteibacter sp.]|nr:hypothetical protein [Luteibacter sp.]
MSFIQVRFSNRFHAQVGRLPASEHRQLNKTLTDMRMMNNPSAHEKIGNPRMYNRMGAWVRDIDFLNNAQAGGYRLIYSPVTKDQHETTNGLDGHVEVLGIGDPHSGSGYRQVNTLAEVTWW